MSETQIIVGGLVVGTTSGAVSDAADATLPPHITRLAFYTRMTPETMAAIDIASIHNPAATAEQQQQAAMLRVLQQMVQASGFIGLDDPRITGALDTLVAFGLLTQAAATAVLTAPIQDYERP